MTRVIDYIGIIDDNHTAKELFLGLFEPSDTDAGATPIATDPELAEELWAGQNARLDAESAYCDQLQHTFKKKQQTVDGQRDNLLTAAREVIERIVGGAVGGVVTSVTGLPLVGWLASVLAEMAVNWAVDYLLDSLTQGHALLDGIKAENAALLRLEKSRENYEYREQVLVRHRDDIRLVLDQIRQAERDVADFPGMDVAPLLEALRDLRYQNIAVEGPGGRTQILQGGSYSDNDALAVE